MEKTLNTSASSDSSFTLPEGFTFRPMTMDDLEAAVEFVNTCKRAMRYERFLTVNDTRRACEFPRFNPEESTRLILSPENQIVGHVWVWDAEAIPVHVFVRMYVHPAWKEQGLETFLLTWGENRARQAITRVPEDVRVVMYTETVSTYQPAKQLYEKWGMKVVRHFWRMVIDLDQEPPEPQWPERITVCTYQDYTDLRAICRACEEAFQDHWGYIKQPEENVLKHWQQWVNDEEFDPALLFVALDGDEIAAVELCRPSVSGDTQKGFVFALGVRRPWRRKGLALALLHHAFGECYRRSKRQVCLGVDASNVTGATRLYEKAGMRVQWQTDLYEKELRPGRDLSTAH